MTMYVQQSALQDFGQEGVLVSCFFMRNPYGKRIRQGTSQVLRDGNASFRERFPFRKTPYFCSSSTMENILSLPSEIKASRFLRLCAVMPAADPLRTMTGFNVAAVSSASSTS